MWIYPLPPFDTCWYQAHKPKSCWCHTHLFTWKITLKLIFCHLDTFSTVTLTHEPKIKDCVDPVILFQQEGSPLPWLPPTILSSTPPHCTLLSVNNTMQLKSQRIKRPISRFILSDSTNDWNVLYVNLWRACYTTHTLFCIVTHTHFDFECACTVWYCGIQLKSLNLKIYNSLC